MIKELTGTRKSGCVSIFKTNPEQQQQYEQKSLVSIAKMVRFRWFSLQFVLFGKEIALMYI